MIKARSLAGAMPGIKCRIFRSVRIVISELMIAKRQDYKWQYHGHFRLYEKYGFEMYGKSSWFYIMRKML